MRNIFAEVVFSKVDMMIRYPAWSLLARDAAPHRIIPARQVRCQISAHPGQKLVVLRQRPCTGAQPSDAGGIHADLPSQLAVGKFRNIHQSVKSFDKHGDLSAFFSII